MSIATGKIVKNQRRGILINQFFRDSVRDVHISLLKPHSDLYAFGIFGRDFTKDAGQ